VADLKQQRRVRDVVAGHPRGRARAFFETLNTRVAGGIEFLSVCGFWAKLLSTNTRSRPFEITIAVGLKFFSKHPEVLFLSRTSHIAEDISLNQRSPVFSKKQGCETTEVYPPGSRVVALIGSVMKETVLRVLQVFDVSSYCLARLLFCAVHSLDYSVDHCNRKPCHVDVFFVEAPVQFVFPEGEPRRS
jgi:hypothetical protein